MSTPFACIAMRCAAHLEAAANFEEATGSSAKSKCLPGRKWQCFPIEEKSRRTACPEVRQEWWGRLKLLGEGGPAAFPQNAAFMRLQERSSELKRQGEEAGESDDNPSPKRVVGSAFRPTPWMQARARPQVGATYTKTK